MTAEEFYSGLYPTGKTEIVINHVQIRADLNFVLTFAEAYKDHEIYEIILMLTQLYNFQNELNLKRKPKGYDELMKKIDKYFEHEQNNLNSN